MQEGTDTSGKILSIIIPMYQSEDFIKKCLDSMILGKSDMGRMEILVVNDGSKDGSAALAEWYVRRFPDTVRLLNKENGGHGSAINLGVTQCRGRFMKVVDADDWVYTRGLKMILDILQNTEAFYADVVLAGYQIHDIRDGSTQTVSCGQQNVHEQTGFRGSVDMDAQIGMGSVLHNWSRYRRLFTLHGLIYRTDFYRAQGCLLPEHVYYDDAYFDVVYAARATRIYTADIIFYQYRIGDENQSMSQKNREHRLSQLESVLFQIFETEMDRRTETGMSYWYRRTASFVTDYYATAFLRVENRRNGRMTARAFSRKLKLTSSRLYCMCRIKYFVLYGMHVLHMKDRQLEAYFKIRETLHNGCIGKRACKETGKWDRKENGTN